MRLRHIGTIAATVLLFGGVVASADGHVRGNDGTGGAQAPVGGSGGTGTTGDTGTTSTTGTTGAGTTGTTGTTTPLLPLAPIVLGPDQSATATYDGPVFELTATGLVPFTPPVQNSPTSPVAGGTKASASAAVLTPMPQLEVPGNTAEEIEIDGLGIAAAPENAPGTVQDIVWAANGIIGRPYVWGGGHRRFRSAGYDCSGLVSFALHGGSLLSAPLDSGQFMHWGAAGQGQWMTLLTNSGHVYLDIAGLRLDTSPANDPSGLEGSRWRPLRPGNAGFVKRHPFGF